VTEPVRRAWWPWVGLGAFFALAIAGLIGVAVNGESLAEQIPYVVAFTLFGVVGALLLSRAPGNRIGALLLYGASTAAASFAAGELGTYLVGEGVTEGFWVAGAMILSNLGWVLGILPVLFFLPLLFPDGHLPSRRWLPFAWCFVVLIGFLTIASLVGDPTIVGSVESAKIANPLYISSLPKIEIPDAVFSILLLTLLAGAVAAVVVRFRRSEGVERQQMKWVAVALALVVVSFALSELLAAFGLDSNLVDTIVSAPAFLAIPISIGIAVLQYHLYDLDVVLKKTLVFVVLVILLTAVFLVGLLAVGSVFAGSGLIDWNVAMFLVLFVTGVLIAPLWRVARRIADRFVYGTRATPYEVLTEFSERMGEAYATEDVLGRMAQILGQATGAASARVWLRVGGLLRPAASWPSDAEPADEAAVIGDALPQLPGESAVEVRDRDELLGALSVTMPPSDPMNLSKERLIRDLAAQAGLVLRNVRLVEELRASQRRLVTAQDEERRRLERNIHDGAQQQLVALSVKTRLARDLTARDPAKAAEMLTQIDTEIQTALDDLRDLARGIYPPLLVDKGLGAALDAQARRSPVPISIRADGLGRYAPEVEAAVYFSCLEALQNVAKYAEASSATVILTQSNGHLTFEVVDDGRGFDPASQGSGTGLQGIADRLGALHGDLTVRSEPGAGTRVRGRIEVRT
jgi:signal transduction histidine kinase